MEIERSINDRHEKKVSFEGNNWVLPTDIKLLGSATKALIKKLVEAGWDEESAEVADIEIGFGEAFVNAIAHGNLGIIKPDGGTETIFQLAKKKQLLYATNKKVYVNMEISKNRVSITIRDEGNGFNIKEVINPTSSEGLMRESGRGILLMKTMYFDSVIHNKKGNVVKMIKERKK